MNTLRQIGEFLGDRFARMERLFARKEEVGTVRDDLAAHGGDAAIHRTSAEIRSEITDADLPATLARHVDVDGSIASHDAHAGAHPAIRDVLGNLETHAGEVDSTLADLASLAGQKLDKAGDGRDVTVAFAEAAIRENIASGDRLSVLFGKTARWFSNLGALAFKDRIAKSDLGDALASELDGKVVKEAGKGLSSTDFTHAEKNKLSGIAANANAYLHPATHLASMIEPTADRLFVTPADKENWNSKADLDGSGKVPSSQLPSYVDDVLTYTALAFFPGVGEDGKIYIATDTNRQYRWSGIAYVEISASLALGETSSSAYRGDRGKAAYDTAQANKSAIEGLQRSLDGKLSSVDDGSGLGVNFSELVARENIVSGENLSVLFGKVRKWFSSLGTLAFKDTVTKRDLETGLQAEIDNKLGKSEDIALPFGDVLGGRWVKQTIAGYDTVGLHFNRSIAAGIWSQLDIYTRGGDGFNKRVEISESGMKVNNNTVATVSQIPVTLPASDVSDWAKAANKPGYNLNEISFYDIGQSSSKFRKPMMRSLKTGMGFVQIITLGQSREPSGWGRGMLSVGVNDIGTEFVDFEFDINGRIISPAGTFALMSDFPDKLPADGGNADTVDGLHAAPAGQVQGGKLASYQDQGYFNAKIFKDDWPIENENPIKGICYKTSTDDFHRFCSVERLREVLNAGNQTLNGDFTLNTSNSSIVNFNRGGLNKGHVGLGSSTTTDIFISNAQSNGYLRIADDGRNYSNGGEIATIDRLPVVVKSSAEPSGAFKDGDIWIQP